MLSWVMARRIYPSICMLSGSGFGEVLSWAMDWFDSPSWAMDWLGPPSWAMDWLGSLSGHGLGRDHLSQGLD